MPLRPVDQLALDERLIDDPVLEERLEERLRRQGILSNVRKDFEESDEAAKTEIAKLELPEGTAVRVGRFRLERRSVPSRSVSFETDPSTRVSIKVIEDEDAGA